MAIKAERTGDLIRITKRTYALIIIDQAPFHWNSVTFDIKNSNSYIEMLVSGRDLADYETQIQRLRIDPAKLYLDVGAGLGEFIHKVLERDPQQKPIIIDPVDYALMLEMLHYAELFTVKEPVAQRIKTYQERCRAILTPEKIRLVNCRLEEALEKHPDLEEIADVVMDHYAAAYYGKDKQKVISIENKLLRPNGKRYCSYHC